MSLNGLFQRQSFICDVAKVASLGSEPEYFKLLCFSGSLLWFSHFRSVFGISQLVLHCSLHPLLRYSQITPAFVCSSTITVSIFHFKEARISYNVSTFSWAIALQVFWRVFLMDFFIFLLPFCWVFVKQLRKLDNYKKKRNSGAVRWYQ